MQSYTCVQGEFTPVTLGIVSPSHDVCSQSKCANAFTGSKFEKNKKYQKNTIESNKKEIMWMMKNQNIQIQRYKNVKNG